MNPRLDELVHEPAVVILLRSRAVGSATSLSGTVAM
jgi:hypothetical protein